MMNRRTTAGATIALLPPGMLAARIAEARAAEVSGTVASGSAVIR